MQKYSLVVVVSVATFFRLRPQALPSLTLCPIMMQVCRYDGWIKDMQIKSPLFEGARKNYLLQIFLSIVCL